MGVPSLKWKYIIATVLILLLLNGLFVLYNLGYQERLIKQDDIRRVELITEIIKNGLYTIMLEGRGKDFQGFLESLIAEEIQEVRIFDPYSGTILASSVRSEVGRGIYEEDRRKFQSQKSPEVFVHERKGERVYSMLVPIKNEFVCQRCHNDGRPLRGVLDVEVSMKQSLKRINELRQRSVLFTLMSSFVVALALAVMTRVLVNRPLDEIIKAMEKVKKGDLTARVNLSGRDEFSRLAESFNSMIGELNKARAELQRCHLEEMKKVEKMATLGELAAAVAHEIKNPLAGISGAVQVIYEDLKEGDPKKEVLKEVLQEIERLDRTVRDLLLFARPVEPKKIPVDISSVVDRCISLISDRARKQNVNIVRDFQEGLIIGVDPQQIQQVLMNLFINALQAMPSGGTLRVEVHREDPHLEIVIADTGDGIPPEELNMVFRPFYTTRTMGTSLGLSITRNIVEAHGGEINVESTLGMGTTFRIKLPV